MRRQKRLFDWCQRPVNPMVLTLRRYSVPLVASVIATVLLVSFFLLSSGSLVRTPPNVPDSPITVIESTPQPTLAPTATPDLLPSNNSLLTKEEAIAIATPYITKFADQKNRSIINIGATFRNSSFRTDDGFSNRPCWEVYGNLDRSGFTMNDTQWWTVGYQVVIWADTAEINYKQALCVM